MDVDVNDNPPQTAAERKVAVAISGGGYRASAWGLGVLWALVNCSVNRDVTMISSVSGGSLTNAHAAQSTPFHAMTRRLRARRRGRWPTVSPAAR